MKLSRSPLGASVRAARTEHHLRQRTLAGYLSVSRTAISNLESERPDLQRKGTRALRSTVYPRLARLLGWPVQEIVQQRLLSALVDDLRRRRAEAHLTTSLLAGELEGRLSLAELRNLEDNVYGREELRLMTQSLVTHLVLSTGWLPPELSRADLKALPAKLSTRQVLSRRLRASSRSTTRTSRTSTSRA